MCPVHVCVLSLFSLSLLIITGLRARISLSAGQPCHISSKQAPSFRKRSTTLPSPGHSSRNLSCTLPFASPALSFLLLISRLVLSFSLFPSVLPSVALFSPLFVLPVESVFSITLSVKVSVMGRSGAPDKKNLYVVFSRFFF